MANTPTVILFDMFRILFAGVAMWMSACGGEDVFELKIVACPLESSVPAPAKFRMSYYSLEMGLQCYTALCRDPGQEACLLGFETPVFEIGTSFSMRVTLYEDDETVIGCSPGIDAAAVPDSRITLALSCQSPTLNDCPPFSPTDVTCTSLD